MTEGGKKITKCLKRLKRGDNCFDELIDCSVGYVGYVAHKNLVDKSYLSDAISETYRNVVRYIGTLKIDGNPLGWLCKIAQNEANKINKRELKRRELSADENAADVAVHDVTDKILEAVDLYNALDRLDELDRAVIDRVYFEDMPYRAVAEELGISVSDVFYRKKTALKKLLEFLSD